MVYERDASKKTFGVRCYMEKDYCFARGEWGTHWWHVYCASLVHSLNTALRGCVYHVTLRKCLVDAKSLKKREGEATLRKQKCGHIHKDSYVHTYQPRRPATTLHTTALGSKKSGQTRKGGKHLLPLKWSSPGGATSQSMKDNKWTKPNYSYVAIHYMFLKTSSVFIQCMKLYNVCMSHTPYIQKFCHLNRCVVKSKYVG